MVKQSIEQVAHEDGRFDPRALKFVMDGLGQTIEKLCEQEGVEHPRHVSGQELSWGLAETAQKRWGKLAGMVLNYWGIKTTRDWGEIVYLMIRHEWMTSQDTDCIEDFDAVYDFSSVFERNYKIEIK